MALNRNQQDRLRKLEVREQRGTLQERGANRLEELRRIQDQPASTTNANRALRRLNIDKPKSVIRGQREFNQEAADETFRMQNPSQQQNPYGYQNVTRDENGNVTVESGFSPEQQAIYDSQNQYLQSMYGNLAGGTGGFGDAASERQRIEEQLYGSYTRGFDDQKARERAALDQSLAERGIPIGSGEAYANAVESFERGWGDRYDEARRQATAGGGQEWERSALLPLQQAQGLFQLGGPTMGSFAQYQGGSINPTDVGGISSTYRGQNISRDIANQNRASQERIARLNNQANTARPLPPPGYE